MEFRRFEEEHVDDCLRLLEAQYGAERRSVPILPPFSDYLSELRGRLERMAKKALGWVLVEGGRLKAMMGGYEVPEFFGSENGVFVPAYANLHETSEEAGLLYGYCAERWVRNGLTSHALGAFAHAEATLRVLARLGFGMRCVDSVRATARLMEGPVPPSVVPVDRTMLGELAEVHSQHGRYYRGSPMFMPVPDEDPVQDLLEWTDQPDRHILGYYAEGRCLGYIRLQRTGESAFSSHPTAMNVTGLYVVPELRGRSIGKLLLDSSQAFLEDRGYSLTGVDFETINPAGSRFWDRYFVPYSYSLARRIDERARKYFPRDESA